MSLQAETSGAGQSPELSAIDQLRQVLNNILRGKSDVIEYVLACLLARGHLLIEDAPGLGKTTLAKALAHAIGGRFARIQCTPDLLPGDITGFNIYNQQSRAFEFRAGPVFADVLLADEINRATPRTQSALLEVMAERQVTVDNETHRLPERFFVIATQNPIELHGTFPLPEAQLDRFSMKLQIGYPSRDHVMDILASSLGWLNGEEPPIEQAVSREELHDLQRRVAEVSAETHILEYLARMGESIREHSRVHLGVSPRGLLVWLRCAQAWAVLGGRDFVTPADVQAVARPVLAIRLGLEDDESAQVVREVLAEVEVPVLG